MYNDSVKYNHESNSAYICAEVEQILSLFLCIEKNKFFSTLQIIKKLLMPDIHNNREIFIVVLLSLTPQMHNTILFGMVFISSLCAICVTIFQILGLVSDVTRMPFSSEISLSCFVRFLFKSEMNNPIHITRAPMI